MARNTHPPSATPRPRDRFRSGTGPRAIAAALLLLAAACKPPPEHKVEMPLSSVERGRQAIASAGCGSCHTIQGIRWPQGRVGPELANMTDRALIAGRLPNRPDVLAAFIRNAPALVPGTAMPAMPVSERQARDIAAFLYAAGGG